MSAPETTPVLAPLLPRLRAERALEAAAASASRPLEARGVELEIGLPDGARAPLLPVLAEALAEGHGERATQIRPLDGDVLHRLGGDSGIGRHRGRVHRGIQSLDLRSARGRRTRPPNVLWNAH